MPKPMIPVAKKVFVCDDVIGDPESGKVSVLNIWNTVRVRHDGIAYAAARMCVFAEFRGGSGEVKTHVEIANALSGKVLRKSDPFNLVFSDRHLTLRTKIILEDVGFPSLGTYIVELYCDQLFVDDQPIRVVLETA